jgi:hypothetical protein
VLYRIRREPLATGHDCHELGDDPLGQCHVGRLAGQGQRVSTGVEIGSEDALECAQIFVGGP